MDKLIKKYIMERAISHFGKKHQMEKAIEEVYELFEELLDQNIGQGTRKNLKTEIVDVEIMIEQLKIMFDISETEHEKEVEFKLERLRKLING